TLRPPQMLSPGRWEVALAPSAAYYAARCSAGRVRADGWNEVEVAGAERVAVTFTLSARPAKLRGTVTDGDKPVPGVPVYVEAEGRDTRMLRTDTTGLYEFYGLSPGAYRVLATFDGPAPDGARVLRLEEGQEPSLDLALWRAR